MTETQSQALELGSHSVGSRGWHGTARRVTLGVAGWLQPALGTGFCLKCWPQRRTPWPVLMAYRALGARTNRGRGSSHGPPPASIFPLCAESEELGADRWSRLGHAWRRLVGRARATSGSSRPIRRLAWGWELERAGCLRGWGFTVRTGCAGGLDCVLCVSDGLCVCSLHAHVHVAACYLKALHHPIGDDISMMTGGESSARAALGSRESPVRCVAGCLLENCN